LISNHFRSSVGGPEKAGVGGSIPSLATNNFNNLAIRNEGKEFLARTIASIDLSHFTFGVAR
jgi:hypothetical protein